MIGIYLDISLKFQPKIFWIIVGEVFVTSAVLLSIHLYFCTEADVCEKSLCGTRWIQNVGAVILSGYIITQIIVICHQHEILKKIKHFILQACEACARAFGNHQTTEVLPMNEPQLQINNMVFILLSENSFNKIGLSSRSSSIPKSKKIVYHWTSCQCGWGGGFSKNLVKPWA